LNDAKYLNAFYFFISPETRHLWKIKDVFGNGGKSMPDFWELQLHSATKGGVAAANCSI
jgi:hypothetical protein